MRGAVIAGFVLLASGAVHAQPFPNSILDTSRVLGPDFLNASLAAVSADGSLGLAAWLSDRGRYHATRFINDLQPLDSIPLYINTPGEAWGDAVMGIAAAGAGFLDMYIGRVTEYGYLLWTRTVGTTQQDYAKAVVPTQDSCYLIVGASQSGSAFRGDNLYIVKLDDYGDTVWTHVYPSDGPACLNDIVALGDTGFMCVGYSPYHGTDAIMMRLDANGDSMWCRHHGGHELDEKAYDVDVTEDGQFWVAGTKVEPQGPDEDIWVFGANSLGNGIGEFVWGGDIGDRWWGVLACSDGGWIAAGQSWNQPPGPNCVAVKSVPRGNLIRNGDFQYWRSEVDPFGWFAEDTTKARVEQCADTVYSPPYSARLTRLVAGTGDNAGVQRFIHVNQGEDYTLTARMLDLSDDAAGGIGISWYDAETSYIRSSGAAYTDSGISDWQELSVTDAAPESAALARVRVRVYGHSGSQPGGVIYADQVALVKGVTGDCGGTDRGVTQPRPSTIIARGTLRLPAAPLSIHHSLFDLAGREVMELQSGENDIRHVAPGVYFCRPMAGFASRGSAARRVLIAR